MASEEEAANNGGMPTSYKPSLSTGVYGSYRTNAIKPEFKPSDYRPAFSTGVYGSYTINPSSIPSAPPKPPKLYTYLPSVSNGTFGTWIYNESSPYTIPKSVIKPKKTTKTTKVSNKKQKSEKKGYQFQIKGPRDEKIKNGKKYNVKLIQEYKLPIGKPLKKMLKKNKQEQKNDNNTNNDSNGTGTLYICEGSVVSFSGECIINAANEGMLGGGGVDGAISSAGGDALYLLRKQVPTVPGSKYARCKTGDAKITQSGYPYNRLKCDYVIHAVGPNYSSAMYGKSSMKVSDIDHQLYTSYARSMLLCREYGIKSVGFCLISSGIFRGSRSLDDVLRIGIEALRDYMFEGIEVYMIGYTHSELACLAKQAPKVLGTPTKEHSKVEARRSWGGGGMWRRSNDDDDDDGEGGGGGSWWKRGKKGGGGGKKKGGGAKKGWW